MQIHQWLIDGSPEMAKLLTSICAEPGMEFKITSAAARVDFLVSWPN